MPHISPSVRGAGKITPNHSSLSAASHTETATPPASLDFTARVSPGAQYTSVPPSVTRDKLEQAGKLGPSVPIRTGRTLSGSPATAGALSTGGTASEQAVSNSAEKLSTTIEEAVVNLILRN